MCTYVVILTSGSPFGVAFALECVTLYSNTILGKVEKRMGVLKYAILGLLNRKNMTGYDITRECETSLFEFWNAKHSQIYPELKSLTQAGLVEYQIQISGTVLQKKVYSITPAGREVFENWERMQHKIQSLPKDEFRLQLFFSDTLAPEHRIDLLQARLKEHTTRLEHLHQNLRKFDALPPTQEEAFSDYMVLLGAVMREESYCQWLQTCIHLCQQRNQTTPCPDPS